MPPTTRPPQDGNQLRRRLAALRRRLLLVTTFRGVSWLLAATLTAVVAAGLLDWRWHLPALVRAILLVGTLSAALAIAYRYLFEPLGSKADDLTLALQVEAAYPALNDSLASTVQFLEGGSTPGTASLSMKREAVRRAMGHASGCDFNRVVDTRGLRTAAASVTAACAAGIVLLVLFPAQARTALIRLAHPFGKHQWPTLTQVALDPPKLRIGRNEAYAIRGVVTGVIPPRATVVIRFDGMRGIELQVGIKSQADGTGLLETRLEPGRITRSFQFQVKANDFVSDEYAVEVLAPPSLVPLDGMPSPQVELRYPAYTGLPSPNKLSPGDGNIQAVTGTRVTLRAAADRRLRRAWIDYLPQVQPTGLSVFVGALAAPHAPAVLTQMAGGREVWEPVEAVLDPDHTRFTVGFLPRVHGMYVLHIEDETGLSYKRPFELRLQPDPAPTVHLQRPSQARDFLTVLPTAELPLEVLAEDTQYALRSVFVEYRTDRAEAPRRLLLYDEPTTVAGQLGPLAGLAVRAANVRLRPTRLEFNRTLSLRNLHHADGSPLHEGDVVLLQAAADDFDDVTVDKQPGRSHQVELHIVNRNALDLALNQEEAKVQQELLRQREKQREALQKVTEVENRLKKGDLLTPDDLVSLVQAEQLQQQVHERVGNRTEGLRADVARILRSLRQNGMRNSAVRERMDDVARELDRLAERELQEIEPRLTAARQQAELLDPKTRAEFKAQLERRAKEAEAEAAKAERTAQQRLDEAEKAERQAEAESSKAEQARQREKAKRERQRAEELREQARRQREQAKRDRREAAEPIDQAKPRRALAEARRGQEEVEKTLSDLLRRLEPSSSSREIKGEASNILREQRRLAAELEEAQKNDKDMVGKKPEELTPRQRAELENLHDAQQRLLERTNQLLDKMRRIAEERGKQDPDTAKALKEAADQATDGNVAGQMQSAAKQLQQNELNKAQESQQKSIAELRKLVKNLEDRREAELDRLIKKMKEAEKKLDGLVKEQERLQKKIKEASKIKDPKEREEALQQLARRQQGLRKKAKEMAQELSRLRAERSSRALGRAGDDMEEGDRQLTRGQQAEENGEDVLDRLDEAQEELQRARERLEDELAREQVARVAETLERIKGRQQSLVKRSEQARRELAGGKKWTRGMQFDMGNVADAQKGLAGETAAIAKKDLTGAPVFARLLRRSAEAMEDGGDRLRKMIPRGEFDEQALQLQKQALRRLTQILDAIKPGPENGMAGARGRGGPGGDGGGPGGGGGAESGDGIPPLAQLKLLRALQKDVNDRTDAFTKAHPEGEKLTAKEKAELQGLRRDQQDVGDLVDELTRPADEPDAKEEGDKKP